MFHPEQTRAKHWRYSQPSCIIICPLWTCYAAGSYERRDAGERLSRSDRTEFVPPLPELDLDEYSFRPWRKGQGADTFPETQEERDRIRESKRIKKEE